MDGFSWNLLLAAAGIALTHTLLGPDHYLPFILLSRARGWSARRTTAITAICGVGHVASSLLLGAIGLALGAAVGRLEGIEGSRGSLAAWALVAFGVAYAAWGVRRAVRRSRGIEPHEHGGHIHLHSRGDKPHQHGGPGAGSSTTFWALLVVFVLGPCEPLIPLFVLPASRGRWGAAALTAVVFGVITIITMVGLTLLGSAGLSPVRLGVLARWDHAIAGAIIALTGFAVLSLGL
jgi:nickel/cobalt exporter